MKIIHNNQAQVFKDGDIFTAYEYETHDRDINVAHIEIKGRYPVKGQMRNVKVKELIYVENGSGTVTINGSGANISKGDVIFLEPGEKIVWNGNFSLIVSCSPAWTKEQHEFLP